MISASKKELKEYAGAGAVAEEVLTAIKTVFAFNGSKKEHKLLPGSGKRVSEPRLNAWRRNMRV
jgi:hypothetical protein